MAGRRRYATATVTQVTPNRFSSQAGFPGDAGSRQARLVNAVGFWRAARRRLGTNCDSAKTTAGRSPAGSRDNNTGQANAPTAMARLSGCSVTSSELKLGVHGPRVFGRVIPPRRARKRHAEPHAGARRPALAPVWAGAGPCAGWLVGSGHGEPVGRPVPGSGAPVVTQPCLAAFREQGPLAAARFQAGPCGGVIPVTGLRGGAGA